MNHERESPGDRSPMGGGTPEKLDDWTARMRWAGKTLGVPTRILETVRVPERVIEDFRPLHLALEWRIAELYWQRRGILPFAQNEVPFVINNTGRLSECAAQVLWRTAWRHRPTAPSTSSSSAPVPDSLQDTSSIRSASGASGGNTTSTNA